MSIKSTFHIFISAIGYLAMFLLGATSGIIHPVMVVAGIYLFIFSRREMISIIKKS